MDHLALTVAELPRSVAFYRAALQGELVEEFRLDGEVAVVQIAIGGAMLNLHRIGHGHWLVAMRPQPGSGDVCLRWTGPITSAVSWLDAAGVDIIERPVARVAADGRPGRSVYFRDPDGNLLELLSTAATDQAGAR